MMLPIPDEVVAVLRGSAGAMEAELLKELALALYQREILPVGKAATLAQMSRWDFEQLLCERKVERQFSEQDLAEDLKLARDLASGI